MKRIIRDLAAETNSVPAQAADQIDKVVHDLLRRLRDGKPANLPGLGVFIPGPQVQFQFEQTNDSKSTRNRQQKPRRSSAGRRT
jgi:hypothetical protein